MPRYLKINNITMWVTVDNYIDKPDKTHTCTIWFLFNKLVQPVAYHCYQLILSNLFNKLIKPSLSNPVCLLSLLQNILNKNKLGIFTENVLVNIYKELKIKYSKNFLSSTLLGQALFCGSCWTYRGYVCRQKL